MKKVFLLFLITHSYIFGQDFFISPNQNTQNLSAAIQQFISQPTVGNHSVVSVNFSKLTQKNLSINFFGENIKIYGGINEVRGINNFTWLGKDENGISYVFTILDDDISGFFVRKNKICRIIKVGGQYLMYEVNQGKFPSESCHLERLVDKKLQKARETQTNQTGYSCKVRVLFYYTNAANNTLNGGSMKNFAQSCIDVANTAYANSNIAVRLEMAYLQNTSFTEVSSDMGASLDAFTNKTDGIMDEVHNLRTQYSADLCVLLGSYTSSCGIAWLYSSYDYGFSVDDIGCAVNNLTFPHELGHNFGAYHDPYVSSGNPAAYGYGYVNLTQRWRTIMAYNNQCADNGFNCTRIPYFSNPNINYLGNPTGTANNHDNARLHNERTNAILSLQQPSTLISLSSTSASGLFGFAIAKDKIENVSTFTLNTGKIYTFHAANKVELKPGFSAGSGSVFKADIAPITNCLAVSDPNLVIFEAKTTDSPSISIQNNTFRINQSKNFIADWLDVRGEKIETTFIENNTKVVRISENARFLRLKNERNEFIYQLK